MSSLARAVDVGAPIDPERILVPGDAGHLARALLEPRPRTGFKIGGEFELFGLDVETGRPVLYDGPRGIGALFASVAVGRRTDPVYEDGRIIAVPIDLDSKLSLEPGGQVELSGAPHACTPDPASPWGGRTALEATAQELASVAHTLSSRARDLGLAFYQCGRQPFFATNDVPWMPKGRYAVMREHFTHTGELGHRMMKETGSIQVNLDASSAEDLARKFRVAMRFSPVATAMFANSPVRERRPSGFLSERAEIWRHTDPARCGLVRAAFDDAFGLDDYVRYALDVPMIFVHRDARYHAMGGVPFRHFLERGHNGFRATWPDWTLHLSTLFPDARLKGHLEIRCADGLPQSLSMAPLALWSGLLYDEAALAALEQLVHGWTYDAVSALAAEVPRVGLAARIGGRTAGDVAREALALARAGLAPTDRRHLAPLEAQLALHGEPARSFLAGWAGGWKDDLAAFLAANGIER